MIRYEGKHGYFKNVVGSKKNFKNVCKMLAEHHQIDQANCLCSYNYFKPDICNNELVLLDVNKYTEAEQRCFYAFDCSKLFKISKVTIGGILYKQNLLIVRSVDLVPQLGKIREVLVYNSSVHFLIQNMESGFLEHVRMMSVIPTDTMQIISIKDCHDVHPLVDYIIRCCAIAFISLE